MGDLIARTESAPLRWHRSSRCGGAGDCVEIALMSDGRVGLRDSKNPSAGMIVLSAKSYETFLAEIKYGTA